MGSLLDQEPNSDRLLQRLDKMAETRSALLQGRELQIQFAIRGILETGRVREPHQSRAGRGSGCSGCFNGCCAALGQFCIEGLGEVASRVTDRVTERMPPIKVQSLRIDAAQLEVSTGVPNIRVGLGA